MNDTHGDEGRPVGGPRVLGEAAEDCLEEHL